MMKPFYQGKVDTFCALYAVLNALRLTHSIRTLQGRSLFSAELLRIAKNPVLFRQVLDQTTDYIDVIDSMIQTSSQIHPLICVIPFAPNTDVSVDQLWDTLDLWINSRTNSTALLRFMRYINPPCDPCVRHWTTVGSITNTTIHLFDSSHEADAILHLDKDRIKTNEKQITSADLLYVQPSSIRLLRLKGALPR
ncbi:MAG: hypothetical protein IJS54_01370 [Desulfovibrio sp.]|nr:hypothetical protein [Desulfovibrio sp.]